jgi:hypothetical protein
MLFTKVKVVAGAFLVCVAGLAVVAFATAQRSGADAPKKETPQARVVKTNLKGRPLSAEALAAHLGVIHQSFELSFDKPVKVMLSVDVYENGKRTVEGRHVLESSHELAKKHACSVLFLRGKEEGKLLITVVTSVGTYNDVIDDPFGGSGLIYPGPRMDAEGRIPLALKAAKQEGESIEVSKVTIANAAKAIVVQVKKP